VIPARHQNRVAVTNDCHQFRRLRVVNRQAVRRTGSLSQSKRTKMLCLASMKICGPAIELNVGAGFTPARGPKAHVPRCVKPATTSGLSWHLRNLQQLCLALRQTQEKIHVTVLSVAAGR
jgi:hypothetical protein